MLKKPNGEGGDSFYTFPEHSGYIINQNQINEPNAWSVILRFCAYATTAFLICFSKISLFNLHIYSTMLQVHQHVHILHTNSTIMHSLYLS